MKTFKFLMTFVILLSLPAQLWASEFVVVKENTKFYTSAKSKRVFIQGSGGSFITLKVLKEDGKRIQIEAGRNVGCQNIPRHNGLRLTLWISKNALENLTLKKKKFVFKDGSEVELGAGMVVRGKRIYYKGEVLDLEITKEEIGKVFKSDYLPTGRRFEGVPTLSKKGLRFNGNKYLKAKVFLAQKKDDFSIVKNDCRRIKGIFEKSKTITIKRSKTKKAQDKNSLRLEEGAQLFSKNGVLVAEVSDFFLLQKPYKRKTQICGTTRNLLNSKKRTTFCIPRKASGEADF